VQRHDGGGHARRELVEVEADRDLRVGGLPAALSVMLMSLTLNRN
jgi:hypothetical protein